MVSKPLARVRPNLSKEVELVHQRRPRKQRGARSVIVTGPPVFGVDFNFVKQIPIVKTVNMEFQLQVFNVFNRVNFTPNQYTGTNPDSYQITGAVDQARTTQLAFRVTW